MTTNTFTTVSDRPVLLDEMQEHDPAMAELWSEVQRYREACVDARTPTTALRMEEIIGATEAKQAEAGDAWGRVRLVANTPNGDLPMLVQKQAHHQIAERTKIHREYYNRCLAEAPDLAATNVNYWFNRDPAIRTVRMIGALSGDQADMLLAAGASQFVRAFLGKTYKDIGHLGVLNHILPIAFAAGARVQDWNLGLTHFRVKLVTPEATLDSFIDQRLRDVLGERYGGHQFINEELCQFGLSLSNSETGHGMVDLEPLVKVVACTNLLVVVRSKGIRHVGRKNGEREDEFQMADTRTVEDAGTYLKIRDKVIEIFDPSTMQEVAGIIAERANVDLAVPPEQPMMEFVTNVGRSWDLNQNETAILSEEVTKEMARTGSPLTPWMLTQGFTATAKRASDYERGHELQTAGWEVLNDPAEKLLAAGRQAPTKKGNGS